MRATTGRTEQHRSAHLRKEQDMKRLAFAAAVLAFVLVPVAQASPKDDRGHGAVYTMTNSPTGNAVLAFARGENGSLTQTGLYATGGLGGALGSGHSIVVSRDGETVVAVNAGSDSVSAFEVRGNGL